jgi:hypothetical protein
MPGELDLPRVATVSVDEAADGNHGVLIIVVRLESWHAGMLSIAISSSCRSRRGFATASTLILKGSQRS